MPDLWERLLNRVKAGFVFPDRDQNRSPFPTYTPRPEDRGRLDRLPMQSDRERSDRIHAAEKIGLYAARWQREADYRTMLTLGAEDQYGRVVDFLADAQKAVRYGGHHTIPLPQGVIAQEAIQPLIPMLEQFGAIAPDPITEHFRMREVLERRPLTQDEVQTLRSIAAGEAPATSATLPDLDMRGLITVFHQSDSLHGLAVQIEDKGRDYLDKLDMAINQHLVPGSPESVQDHGRTTGQAM